MKNSNQAVTGNEETVSTRLLYSLKEAAYQLSISKRGLAYLCSQGVIPIRKVGGRTLISAHALRAFALSGSVAGIVPSGKGR